MSIVRPEEHAGSKAAQVQEIKTQQTNGQEIADTSQIEPNYMSERHSHVHSRAELVKKFVADSIDEAKVRLSAETGFSYEDLNASTELMHKEPGLKARFQRFCGSGGYDNRVSRDNYISTERAQSASHVAFAIKDNDGHILMEKTLDLSDIDRRLERQTRFAFQAPQDQASVDGVEPSTTPVPRTSSGNYDLAAYREGLQLLEDRERQAMTAASLHEGEASIVPENAQSSRPDFVQAVFGVVGHEDAAQARCNRRGPIMRYGDTDYQSESTIYGVAPELKMAS